TDFLQVSLQVLAGAAVTVSVGVVKLHKTHAALHQPPRQQTIPRKRWFARFDTVQIERDFGLAGEINQFRRAGLHAIRHFVRGNARVDLRIAGLNRAIEVQVADGVNRLPLARGADAGWVAQVQDRIAAAAQRHPLKARRQETAAPVHRAAARSARAALQYDEARQILRLAPDAVSDPRAHARPAELAGTGVHEQLRRRVIEQAGRCRMHERDVVHDARGVREQFADPRAAPAVLPELAPRAEQL